MLSRGTMWENSKIDGFGEERGGFIMWTLRVDSMPSSLGPSLRVGQDIPLDSGQQGGTEHHSEWVAFCYVKEGTLGYPCQFEALPATSHPSFSFFSNDLDSRTLMLQWNSTVVSTWPNTQGLLTETAPSSTQPASVLTQLKHTFSLVPVSFGVRITQSHFR